MPYQSEMFLLGKNTQNFDKNRQRKLFYVSYHVIDCRHAWNVSGRCLLCMNAWHFIYKIFSSIYFIIFPDLSLKHHSDLYSYRKNEDYIDGKRKYSCRKATHKLPSWITSSKQSIHNHNYHNVSFCMIIQYNIHHHHRHHHNHHFHHHFIITTIIDTMNRNSSWDIQTPLMMMMTTNIQSSSIIHHCICIVITYSVVKAKNHCRCHHRKHHHHYQPSWS